MTTGNRRPSARIFVGVERFADPWHDFRASGEAVATALHAIGVDARVEDFAPDALTELDTSDLVVINAGYDRSTNVPLSKAWTDGFASLSQYINDGRPLLALHSTAATFRAVDGGHRLIGGAWIDGESMHPPRTLSRVDTDPAHALTRQCASFETLDEMYCFLELTSDTQVFAQYSVDGISHPLAWTNSTDGRRVVYDALGHDAPAYDSIGRRELLAAEVAWLLAQ